MAGIEFVGGDAEYGDGDDLLDTGPSAPVPRWVWVVAALVVAAVGLGVAISSGTDTTPKALPTPIPSTSLSGSTSSSTSSSLRTGPVPQISVLTSDGTSLFWVAGNRLYRAGPVGRAGISTPISPEDGEFAELQLVADPAERTIWLVSRGSSDSSPGSGTIQGFSTTDLKLVTSATAPSLINGAAASNGALYVLSADRLLRTTARRFRLTSVAAVDTHAHNLVALKGSLYYVQGANSSEVGRWTPSGGVQPPVALGTTDSSLAVVGSTVFVAGIRAGQDVLDTLGPTGRVTQRGIDTGLTSHVQIVATGSRSVLLVGTSLVRGLGLSCVRAGDDALAREQPTAITTRAVSANVAVLRGMVFEAVGDGVQEADLDNCPG